jgi:hypothetical protein
VTAFSPAEDQVQRGVDPAQFIEVDVGATS